MSIFSAFFEMSVTPVLEIADIAVIGGGGRGVPGARSADAREEALGDQVAHDREVRRPQVGRVPVEQLAQRREDLVHGQLAVAGTDEGRLDGVDLAAPTE